MEGVAWGKKSKTNLEFSPFYAESELEYIYTFFLFYHFGIYTHIKNKEKTNQIFSGDFS